MNIQLYLTGFHFLNTQCFTRYRFLNFVLGVLQLTISHHVIGFHMKEIKYPEQLKILFLHLMRDYTCLQNIILCIDIFKVSKIIIIEIAISKTTYATDSKIFRYQRKLSLHITATFFKNFFVFTIFLISLKSL